jgi:hypothetical protein
MSGVGSAGDETETDMNTRANNPNLKRIVRDLYLLEIARLQESPRRTGLSIPIRFADTTPAQPGVHLIAVTQPIARDAPAVHVS